MRFDTPVFFQKAIPGEYDIATGNYGPDIVSEIKKYASVTDTGVATLSLIYGELRQGSKVVRLQTSYNQPFDRIRISDKKYRVDFSRRFKTKQVYVVSEVQ